MGRVVNLCPGAAALEVVKEEGLKMESWGRLQLGERERPRRTESILGREGEDGEQETDQNVHRTA